MLRLTGITRDADPDLALSTNELVLGTTRSAMTAIGIVYLVWHILATATWPDLIGERVYAVSMIMAAATGLGYWSTRKMLWVGQVLWLVGLGMALLVAIPLFGQGEIAYGYVLLPFLTTITLGPAAGGLALTASGSVLAVMCRGPLSTVLTSATVVAVVASGAVTWIVGWSASRTLYTVTLWSVAAMNEARRKAEDAKEHRARLAQVVKDLDQAYERLQRLNTALISAWNAAQEAERAKAEFVTRVSHELRTPLNLIVGFAEMMATAPENYGYAVLPGPYRADVAAIYKSARHLLALVDDVLDLSRADVGRLPLMRDVVNLGEIICQAVDMVRDYVVAKGLSLVVEIQPELPLLNLDPLRIKQVILNLLVNAVRFTEAGSVTVRVSTHNDGVIVEVCDTGRGIAPEVLPHVFDEFRTGDVSPATNGWHSGSGLGLSISKKLVELHGGQMGVSSIVGRGATFWFQLPAGPSQDGTGRIEMGIYQRTRPIPETKRPVVVVHRDAFIWRLLARHLERYEILGARTSSEAEELATQTRAVAVVIDAQEEIVPVASGAMIIRAPFPDLRAAVQVMGATDRLVKPVARAELLAAIDGTGCGPRRILVVDDDPDFVRLLRRMLADRLEASSILEAASGEEALEMLEKVQPDLMLLDLSLPGMDGREVLARMSAGPSMAQVPVIVISAHDDQALESRLEAPVEIWAPNGLSLHQVLALLENSLDVLNRCGSPLSPKA
ncbi:MAG: ATP-binding protein [Anaerolineae bacterium]